MQIYTTKDGKKQGPFTIYRIKELVDADELSLDNLGWHEGLDQWRPLKDISIVTATIESLNKKIDHSTDSENDGTNATIFPYWEHLESHKSNTDGKQENESTDEPSPSSPVSNSSLPLPSGSSRNKSFAASGSVHPFLRFWARFFDYLLLNTLVWFVFDHPPIPDSLEKLIEFYKTLPQEEQIRIALIQGGALFVWNFIEALLISSFGTTPGKMLFNIKVTRKNGNPLKYSEAIGRSLMVWILGVGIGLAFLQILAMTFSLFYLLNKGECAWDRTLHTQVHHRPLGPQKIVLAVGAYLVLLSLQHLLFS